MANSSGTSHSLQGLEWPTQKPACRALSFSSAATLQRTLNRTFHPPHHRGKPLNDDRERKIPPLGPMTPFCCQADVSADRESNMASCRWNASEGHGTVQREEKEGTREGEEERQREGVQLFLSKLSHLEKKMKAKKLSFHHLFYSWTADKTIIDPGWLNLISHRDLILPALHCLTCTLMFYSYVLASSCWVCCSFKQAKPFTIQPQAPLVYSHQPLSIQLWPLLHPSRCSSWWVSQLVSSQWFPAVQECLQLHIMDSNETNDQFYKKMNTNVLTKLCCGHNKEKILPFAASVMR